MLGNEPDRVDADDAPDRRDDDTIQFDDAAKNTALPSQAVPGESAEPDPEDEADPEAEVSEEPTPPARRPVVSAMVLFMAPTPGTEQGETREVRDTRDTREVREQAPRSLGEPEPSFAEEQQIVPLRTRRRRRRSAEQPEPEGEQATFVSAPVSVAGGTVPADHEVAEAEADDGDGGNADFDEEGGRRRRRRGRRGRGRGKGNGSDDYDDEDVIESAAVPAVAADTRSPEDSDAEPAESPEVGEPEEAEDVETLTRRRRRRRRKGAADAEVVTDSPNVVVRIREPRIRDEVQSVSGSTRLEAKRQRRRDGREQRRTKPPILSESEFLARRESVDRVMVVRQHNDRTQIAVLEDGVLVEHYVARASAATMVGNVYLGRVQNVLPSMEAAFVDLGRGRNAVLYAGEVNWDATGLEGRTRTIEQALKSGDSVLVQVTKDPIGTKGARLTSHSALSGRHLVFVPNGNASGISRKLPDVERKRLRDILKNLVPDGAGVIVRTAAEGATEEELARDVKRLEAQWDDIQAKSGTVSAPSLLYQEPDLVIRVVRDLFNEDFRELIIQGSEAYETVEAYLSHVSPDLVDRIHRYTGTGDVFAAKRIDEQIIKGLDRRVFLPSGGHLVIDRTEAMTVIDVNTGKYTGAGGNLEETVTRNNLEAAEEIVRQLRLRDVGGIIVIDFIDMVLESNRELVLRRLTECLGRDRTKHQVTEITSLGLVQMTRKRVGQGLVEAFSETCEVCKGRGLIFHTEPVPDRRSGNDRSAVAKVVAASVPPVADTPVDGRSDHLDAMGLETDSAVVEPVRTTRRRRRTASVSVAMPESEQGSSPAMIADDETDEVVADGLVSIVLDDESDLGPDTDEDSLAEGGVPGTKDSFEEVFEDELPPGARRRSRRNGSRRRTRP